jgi:hypothetical protein
LLSGSTYSYFFLKNSTRDSLEILSNSRCFLEIPDETQISQSHQEIHQQFKASSPLASTTQTARKMQLHLLVCNLANKKTKTRNYVGFSSTCSTRNPNHKLTQKNREKCEQLEQIKADSNEFFFFAEL